VSWIPYRSFRVQTALAPAEIIARMRAHVESQSRSLHGRVDDHGFRLRPATFYKNGFAPVVRGVVVQRGAVTDLQVTMRPSLGAMVVGIIWLCVWGFATYRMLPPVWPTTVDRVLAMEAITPALMVLGWLGLTSFGFWVDARRVRPTLETIMATEGPRGD